MSKEAVLKLFQTLDKDPDLRERLTAIEDVAEVARIAESELGLNVTAEELTSAVASIQNPEGASPEGELNEEELEAVAGGWFDNWKVKVKPKAW
ncbi:Nif11-like leader peptide family natural product precursor [Coleofasciculus sp. F4-SAH-05]|uniref:Nif11-like leader peptide family natural product precursor n=1 Tax=Coleofasciculus sp. F4-SAH-05 TaxID=3069525 RepID=UPI0032F459DF